MTFALLLCACMISQAGDLPQRSHQTDLPGQERNAIKTSMPGVGTWFWVARDFEPEGYKSFIDLYYKHTNIRLLTTSIRHDRWVGDPAVRDHVRAAAEYARAHDMEIVFDLDVRHSRELFRETFPNEQQELVRLHDVELGSGSSVSVEIEGIRLGDHYTYGPAPNYDSYASRLLRVYSYVENNGLPADIRDITAACTIDYAEGQNLRVTLPASDTGQERKATVLAAFTLFTPDIFSPNLPAFEQGLLEGYAGIPLAGAKKDEWGFPGRFRPSTSELWYSEAMAAAYNEQRPGHDLARDLFLMVRGESGRESARAAAINHYMRMYWQRNAEIEESFYAATKKKFGEQAMAMTHPTWFPYPNANEIFKNGLHWWVAKRDVAQTDEGTPMGVRTALTKKWHSPLWYNMYYTRSTETYEAELWRSVLAGGRINYHQVFPYPDWRKNPTWNEALLKGDLMRAEARVQLLNHISTQPVDSPVAVVFGHAATLNWASTSFADAGVGLTDALWAAGYYADLIPSSEITNGALVIGEDGSVQYGPQRYAAVVFHNFEYEGTETLDFIRKAAAAGKSKLFQVGPWSMDFEGNPIDTTLPAGIRMADSETVAATVIAHLEAQGIEPYTPGVMTNAPHTKIVMPTTSGHLRLIDGTVIHASGTHDVMGDPIQKTIYVNGHDVSFDAIGIAAVRLDPAGKLQAMAAGGLKSFHGGGIRIDLTERTDLALWKTPDGQWHGILQGHEGEIPENLIDLCRNWTRLRIPEPLR